MSRLNSDGVSSSDISRHDCGDTESSSLDYLFEKEFNSTPAKRIAWEAMLKKEAANGVPEKDEISKLRRDLEEARNFCKQMTEDCLVAELERKKAEALIGLADLEVKFLRTLFEVQPGHRVDNSVLMRNCYGSGGSEEGLRKVADRLKPKIFKSKLFVKAVCRGYKYLVTK